METKLYNKVLSEFFKKPTASFHARQLARKIKASHTGVSRMLKQLEKDGIIKLNEKRVALTYSAALDSEKFRLLKRQNNIRSLNKLVDFFLDKYDYPEAIILFGSYASGYDTEQSDIDILIITPKELDLDLRRFERELERRISIHELKDLKSASKEFINNIINGVVLYGYLKVLQ